MRESKFEKITISGDACFNIDESLVESDVFRPLVSKCNVLTMRMKIQIIIIIISIDKFFAEFGFTSYTTRRKKLGNQSLPFFFLSSF